MTAETTTAAAVALRLRVLVAALSEGSQAPWWRTKYLSPTGSRTLSRLYPRSAFGAAVRAVTAAARSLHDSSIGKGDVYHLFRLPPTIEREIEVILAEPSADSRFQDVIKDLGNSAALTNLLAAMSGKTTGKHQGAVRIPNATPENADTYTRMAAVYLDGFHRGERVFPYMESRDE